MQRETTLQTLQDMGFSGETLLVMNKTENLSDATPLPNDSIAISARTGKGIDELKRAILERFSDDFYFCDLFVPYAQMSEYAKIKSYLTERTCEFTDDGQRLSIVIPSRYADKITPFLVNRTK
jgi:50S ribosomal subunit-associated GTPase HflX